MIRKLFRHVNRLYKKMRGYDDYFYIPFNYFKPLHKSAEKVLDVCCSALENNGVPYYVTDGTALGFYRDNGFIKHDDDLDVAIPVKAEIDENKLVKLFTNDLGMHIGRKLTYKGRLQQLVCFNDDEVIFDMCLYWEDEDAYVMHLPECKSPCKYEKKYFQAPFQYDFHGRIYPLHSFIEDWVVYRYGNDWMIPRIAKGDWQEEGCFK